MDNFNIQTQNNNFQVSSLSLLELHRSDLLFLGDLVGHELSGVQDLNGALVLQDVAFRRLQRLQDLVLDLLQLLLVGRRLQDQSVSLLLQLWPGAQVMQVRIIFYFLSKATFFYVMNEQIGVSYLLVKYELRIFGRTRTP